MSYLYHRLHIPQRLFNFKFKHLVISYENVDENVDKQKVDISLKDSYITCDEAYKWSWIVEKKCDGCNENLNHFMVKSLVLIRNV